MKRALLVSTLVLITAIPAFALTAGEVLDKLTAPERDAFISGAVEFAMVTSAPARAECIGNWFFESDGKAQRQIVAAFAQLRDRPAAALINALIIKSCGAEQSREQRR